MYVKMDEEKYLGGAEVRYNTHNVLKPLCSSMMIVKHYFLKHSFFAYTYPSPTRISVKSEQD